MNENVLTFFQNSFLSPLLKNENITDISYNGKDIYYSDNYKGRQKSDIVIEEDVAKNFIRQLANITNCQFSYTNPILDINIDRYRINAVHYSIAKYEEKENVTFSIRIRSKENMIAHNETFMDKKVKELLFKLIQAHVSIVIGGVTGTGKTELQRYLFSLMEKNVKVVIVDSLSELSNINKEELDVTYWEFDERRNSSTIHHLIKTALRNNPDWLIVSEARGDEMEDLLYSTLTGLPIITTIHALSLENMKDRIKTLILNKNKNYDSLSLEKEINDHFPIFIYLNKTYDQKGHIIRYLDSIAENVDGKMNYLYRLKDRQKVYGELSPSLKDKIKHSKLIINNKEISEVIK